MTAIRLAVLTDLPRIVAIYNQAIAAKNATADTVPFTVEQRLDWFQAHPPDAYPVYVYEDEKWPDTGLVVGQPVSRSSGSCPNGRSFILYRLQSAWQGNWFSADASCHPGFPSNRQESLYCHPVGMEYSQYQIASKVWFRTMGAYARGGRV